MLLASMGLAVGAFAIAAEGADREIEFFNSEGQTVTGIEIDTRESVRILSLPDGAYDRRPEFGMQHHIGGLNVPDGGSVTLALQSDVADLWMLRWTWTIGTTPTTDGTPVGTDKPDFGAADVWFLGVSANGNGKIRTEIQGGPCDGDWSLPVNGTAAQCATSYAAFLYGSCPLTSVLAAPLGIHTAVRGNQQTTDSSKILKITIVEDDDDMQIVVLSPDQTPNPEVPIPTLSSWGLVILALIVAAASILWIRRHQPR